jgi:hypothetical protein
MKNLVRDVGTNIPTCLFHYKQALLFLILKVILLDLLTWTSGTPDAEQPRSNLLKWIFSEILSTLGQI